MCSIFGALGHPDMAVLDRLRTNAGDRGRDGGRMDRFDFDDSTTAYVGNWRATPTPEVQHGPLQPYDGLVHNGTVANDAELGGLPGEIDSMVLARVLPRVSLAAFADGLGTVKGSYATACVSTSLRTILAGVNYKPLYYCKFSDAVYFSSMARHFDGVCPPGIAPVQVEPYSVIDFRTFETRGLARVDGRRALAICSGGLDSTVAASALLRDGWAVELIHFDYGCRATTVEAACVERIAQGLGVPSHVLPLPRVFGATSLTAGGADISEAVRGAEYAHEWVPARNLVMLSVAAAYAEANGFHAIALGNNLEESGAYPDNEEQFVYHMNQAMQYATQNGYRLQVLQPVGNLMKHEIVALGLELGAPLVDTWSCYRGGPKHCGACGPCYMRRTAFERNGTKDPVFE